MENPVLVEQVDQLPSSDLAELRGGMRAKLGDDVSAGAWAMLERRVAEADANPDKFVTHDEWKARRRARPTV